MKFAICDDCLEYRSVIAKKLKSLDLIEDISYPEFSCSEDLLYAYNLLINNKLEIKKVRHDLKNVMNGVLHEIENNQVEKAKKYIQDT